MQTVVLVLMLAGGLCLTVGGILVLSSGRRSSEAHGALALGGYSVANMPENSKARRAFSGWWRSLVSKGAIVLLLGAALLAIAFGVSFFFNV